MNLSLGCLYIYLNEFLKSGLEHFSPKNSEDVTTLCSALSLAKVAGDTSLVVVPLCTTCLFYYMPFLYPYNSKLFSEYIYVCIFFPKGGKSWLLWEAIQVKNSSSGLVHWDDPERWDGEGGGRGVQDGEHMYTHGRFMSMYGKTHHNIVK